MTHALRAITLVACLAHPALSQQLPVRPLGAVVATSRAIFRTVGGVYELRDGRILVNDIERRTLQLFDAGLATSRTLADDSTGGSAPAYGGTPARLIPYRGDSTLMVQPDQFSMLVIGPAGSVGPARAVPSTGHVMALVSAAAGTPGFDGDDRFVYRLLPAPQRPHRVNGTWTLGKEPADSAPLVRASLSTRRVDTVAHTRITPPRVALQESPNGKMAVARVYDPMPVADEWVVTSDGIIAIVRSSDYHVEWITPDGRRTSSPRISFPWHRLTPDEKAKVVDAAAHAYASSGPNARPFPIVAANELPDYAPPFARGMIHADEEGRIWLQTTATYANAKGTVYDVIDRQGRLADRIEVPAGRDIVGFGRSGVVFLSSAGAARHVEKVRVR